ncbi:hypothetical protein [Halobacteriovorax sp. HLS]|uniref:hypothetical protein n=1 Tax=Halobacteriovorax sp. HLS TaxID=2234000 RepID=UPI000FD8DE75|nr:hypothetical protein [Halobacteriovorax sp. HLS]
MRPLKRSFFWAKLLVLTQLASCATDIDYHIPLTRFDSPEAKGKLLKGEVGINWGVSHKVRTGEVSEHLFPSIFDPTVDSDTATSRRTHGSWDFTLGLVERVDFDIENYGDGPTMYGLKYQFLGGTELENSKGLKVATKIAIGGLDQDEGNLSVSTTSGTRSYSGNLEVDAYDVSLNVGYRFNDFSLLYFNTIYSYHEVHSVLSSNTFATVVVDGRIRTTGGLLGLRVNSSSRTLFFKLEAGYFFSKWNASIKQKSFPVGLGFDVGW